jgi:hypothetical protein
MERSADEVSTEFHSSRPLSLLRLAHVVVWMAAS